MGDRECCPFTSEPEFGVCKTSTIAKVLTQKEAIKSDLAPECCLICSDGMQDIDSPIREQHWAGVCLGHEIVEAPEVGVVVDRIETQGIIAVGMLFVGRKQLSCMGSLSPGSNSNTLLATERCNSFCVMCSQPPQKADDRYLVDEMLETIPLVDCNENRLGISGREPTLLGDNLLVVLHQARQHLPDTGLDMLSNGRAFSNKEFARTVNAIGHPNLTWAIPVYSDCPEIHDYIVQARGAWDETLEGLYNLAQFDANIEIRIVVQQANFSRLDELAYFIFRNLTFAKHVAFMGLEPIGFARTNYEKVWVDPVDCMDTLRDAVFFLSNRGMNVSLYNFPLCTVPEELWVFAQQSISDWKNVYLSQCDKCEMKTQCCGFFSSINQQWISRVIRPISHSRNSNVSRRSGVKP